MDRPGRPFLFTDRPEKHNLGVDIRILLSVKGGGGCYTKLD